MSIFQNYRCFSVKNLGKFGQISLFGCSLMKKNAQLKIIVQCLICALTYTRKKFEAYWIKHFCFTDRRIFLYFSVPQPQNLAQKFILVQKVFISPYFTSGYYFIMICMHIKAYIANLVFHLCTTLICFYFFLPVYIAMFTIYIFSFSLLTETFREDLFSRICKGKIFREDLFSRICEGKIFREDLFSQIYAGKIFRRINFREFSKSSGNLRKFLPLKYMEYE